MVLASILPFSGKAIPSKPGDLDVKDLRERTIRGGAARLLGHATRSVVRLAALMTLARLLDPSDFGLVAMVTAATGFFEVFATGGLSVATIQRAHVSHAQVSTLFWFNIAIGAVLGLLCLASAPLLGDLYNDPRTAIVMAAVAPAFLINATGVQHLALLQRELRYVTLAVIEVGSEVVAAVVAIGMALAGFGYWAVVAAVVLGPIVITIGAWIASGWIPGLPRRVGDVSPMLRFGGAIMTYGFVIYIAYNIEKVLIGRYYGSDALGLYGKSYELIHLPTRIISLALGMVAFSSLARLQGEPARFKSYFLKGYALFISLTVPAVLACFVFADDIISVVLGPKWTEAATMFRLLAPSVLFLTLIQPLAWLLMALGFQDRHLKMALVLAPLAIGAYLIGLPYGPNGVALAFSIATGIWLVPNVVWSLRGTMISVRELLSAASRPLIAAAIAALAAVTLQGFIAELSSVLLRLAVGGAVMALVYTVMLLVVLKQGALYLDLWRGLKGGLTVRRPEPEAVAP